MIRSLQDKAVAAVAAVRRVLKLDALAGIGANGIALIATLVIQVVTVPVFLSTVGAESFGDWLVLTAIPNYLSLADLGFAGASATAMTQALASGDRPRATVLLNSAWAAVSSVSSLVLLVAIPLSFLLVGDTSFVSLGSAASWVLVVQLLWVAAWMQIGFCEAALRASGNYPRGINYLTGIRVGELLVLAIALFVFEDVLIAAIGILVARLIGGALLFVDTRKRLSWFRFGLRHVSLVDARWLLGPSITYAGLSFGYALLNQGVVIIVGVKMEAYDVVALSTVRTMTNTIQQISSVVTTGALPDLTAKLAVGDRDGARRVQRITYWLSGGPGLVMTVGFSFLGVEIVRIWTGGEVEPSTLFVVLMAATTAADIPWQVMVNILRAQNKHQVVGVVFLGSCVLTLCMIWPLIGVIGLLAVPISLFLLDLIVTPVAFREVRTRVEAVRM